MADRACTISSQPSLVSCNSAKFHNSIVAAKIFLLYAYAMKQAMFIFTWSRFAFVHNFKVSQASQICRIHDSSDKTVALTISSRFFPL